MYENFNAFLFRYIVTVHSVAFISLSMCTVSLGLKPKKDTSLKTKILYSFLYSVPAAQLIASIARINSSFENFSMANPIASLTNFFYSPMLTILILWFILRHFTTSDKFEMSTTRKIKYHVNWVDSLLYLFFGALTSFFYIELSPLYDPLGIYHWLSFLGIALVYFVIKLVISKEISLVNDIIFWYFGTWLFFLHLI